MTVGELLERTDSRELAEWMAFWQIEPFGPEVESFRFGLVAAEVHNSVPRRGGPRSPEDFMPRAERPQPTAREVWARLKQFAAATNERLRKGGG